MQNRPNLPPKRKQNESSVDDEGQRAFSKISSSKRDLPPAASEDIEAGELAIFEQLVNETPTEAIISIEPRKTTDAPIFDDYIDPHAVPFRYLLNQTRQVIDETAVKMQKKKIEQEEKDSK